MEQYVTIKSYQHGFALYLKEDAEFDQILNEIETKFSGSRQFFGSAKVSISLEGMELTEEQEMDIITLIHNTVPMISLLRMMQMVSFGRARYVGEMIWTLHTRLLY